MVKFKLAFPHKGGLPGDVIDVREDDVRDLVLSGIGHLEGAEPVLRLGRLPEVTYPVPVPETPAEPAPEPTVAKRRSKTPDEPSE